MSVHAEPLQQLAQLELDVSLLESYMLMLFRSLLVGNKKAADLTHSCDAGHTPGGRRLFVGEALLVTCLLTPRGRAQRPAEGALVHARPYLLIDCQPLPRAAHQFDSTEVGRFEESEYMCIITSGGSIASQSTSPTLASITYPKWPFAICILIF